MLPPLMAVVPLAAFCTTLAASTLALKVVVPVLVKSMADKACVPPTAPVKVMCLKPVATVRLRAVLVALFSVLLKLMSLLVFFVAPLMSALSLVVAKDTAVARTVGPV